MSKEFEEVKYDFEYLEEANYESSVRSFYVVLWKHLLKYKFNTSRQSTSWLDSINKSIIQIDKIKNNKSSSISNTWKKFINDPKDCEIEFQKAIKEAASENYMNKKLFYKSVNEASYDENVFDPVNSINRDIVKQYLLKYYDIYAKDNKDVMEFIEKHF